MRFAFLVSGSSGRVKDDRPNENPSVSVSLESIVPTITATMAARFAAILTRGRGLGRRCGGRGCWLRSGRLGDRWRRRGTNIQPRRRSAVGSGRRAGERSLRRWAHHLAGPRRLHGEGRRDVRSRGHRRGDCWLSVAPETPAATVVAARTIAIVVAATGTLSGSRPIPTTARGSVTDVGRRRGRLSEAIGHCGGRGA